MDISVLFVDDYDVEGIAKDLEETYQDLNKNISKTQRNTLRIYPFASKRNAVSAIEQGLDYDIALIDLSLEDQDRFDRSLHEMDGVEVISASLKHNPRIPIITLSGYALEKPILGTRMHLEKCTKDCSLNNCLAAIHKVLSLWEIPEEY